MAEQASPPPFKKLADLLASKQGGGKTRRLRQKITIAEVTEAVSLLRTYFPDANLVDPKQSNALCQKALAAALAPSRIPHPDENWDLVSVYAGLRKIERGEACVELGLAIKVTKPEPELTWIEQQEKKLARIRNIIRTLRQRGEHQAVKKAEEIEALIWVSIQREKYESPPPPPPPPPAPPKLACDPSVDGEPKPPPGATGKPMVGRKLMTKEECIKLGLLKALPKPPDQDLTEDDESEPPPGAD